MKQVHAHFTCLIMMIVDIKKKQTPSIYWNLIEK